VAEKIVSPGVFTKEVDASFLPAAIGDIGAVVIGPTVKGPALVPTVVNSYSEYQQKFGDTFKSGSQYYQYLTSTTAENYLRHGSRLTIVRVMGASYSGASATVSASIDPSVVGGGVKSTGSLLFTNNALLGYSASIGGVTFNFTSESAAVHSNTATNLYVVTGSNVTNTAISFKNTVNNSGSLHNLRISASHVAGLVGFTSSLAGFMSSSTINPATAGGSNIGNTLVLVEGKRGGSSKMTLKQLAGGWDYNAGVFTNAFKLNSIGDGAILNNNGTIGTNEVLSTGTKDNIRWEIGSLNQKKGTFSLVIRKGDDSMKRKQILETWNDVSLDPNQSNYIGKVIGTQYISMAGTAIDPYLTFSGDYPTKSKYVYVSDINDTVDYIDENGNIRDASFTASLPTFHSSSNSGSYAGAFQGGSDGTITHPLSLNENIVNANAQGFNLGVAAVKEQYTKALNLLSNADEYDFNLMLLPGIFRNLANHTSVVTKAIDVCEARGDAFVVVDGVDYSVTSVADANTQAKAMNSNYAATYWPWVQTSDSQLGQNVWVPPSVVMGGIYAQNDKIAAPWFAPAGLNRGAISGVVQAARKLTHSNRDELYESNVNPIATFPGQGVVVWGQKTLQKKASALDRVNVRRLMIKVKKFIAASSRYLVFEQNTAQTRERFMNIANPFLEQIQSQSGLNAFKVVMDETNNTPDVVDRNILYGQLFLQPTKTAEFIVLDFTIQPTGAAFPE